MNQKARSECRAFYFMKRQRRDGRNIRQDDAEVVSGDDLIRARESGVQTPKTSEGGDSFSFQAGNHIPLLTFGANFVISRFGRAKCERAWCCNSAKTPGERIWRRQRSLPPGQLVCLFLLPGGICREHALTLHYLFTRLARECSQLVFYVAMLLISF